MSHAREANEWEKFHTVDGLTQATVVVTRTENNIHDGHHFYLAAFETLGLNDIIEFTSVTPDNGIQAHMDFSVLSTVGGVVLQVFEGASGIVGGTPVVPLNTNRNSTNDSKFVNILYNPTSIADDGTQIWGQRAGAQKEIGAAEASGLILRSNETYLWRITSLGQSNVVSYKADWSEEEEKRTGI
jgi:hypothetical protein